MKRVTLVLGTFILALMASSAKADNDPCAAVLCLSQNDVTPWECKGAVDGYFNIREYHKPCRKCKIAFDPPATAARRYREVLQRCEEARPLDRDKINALYGTMEYSPYQYGDNKDPEAAPKKEEEDKFVVNKYRQYYICSAAARLPEFAGKIAKPTDRALSVPDGTFARMPNGTMVKAENGYLAWPLRNPDNVIEMYGFASYDNEETINVRTKEVVNFKSTNVDYFYCEMKDPSLFGY